MPLLPMFGFIISIFMFKKNIASSSDASLLVQLSPQGSMLDNMGSSIGHALQVVSGVNSATTSRVAARLWRSRTRGS